jgi:hypothetical protein
MKCAAVYGLHAWLPNTQRLNVQDRRYVGPHSIACAMRICEADGAKPRDRLTADRDNAGSIRAMRAASSGDCRGMN